MLVGTLDTKGHEYAYLRERIREAGAEVTLVDAGVLGQPQVAADVSREEVAARRWRRSCRAACGRPIEVVPWRRWAAGRARCLSRLHADGRLQGAAAVGGSGNSSIAAAAMRDLPVGVPKLMVSTVASGDTRPYVGAKDITMMYSVVDIAGINQISARILSNAAGAIAGMAGAASPAPAPDRPLVGATMFGVTTPCVDARARAAGGARLRSARVPRHRHRRPGDGGAGDATASSPACWTSPPPSWPTSWSAASCRPARTGWRPRPSGYAAGGLARRARHGQLRAAPTRCPSVSRDRNALRAQPDGDADAHHARRRTRELGAGSPRKLNGAARPDRAVRPAGAASRRSTRRPAVPRPRGRRGPVRRAARGRRPRTVEVRELDADINDPAFADARWPTACTS